jgi:ABC-type Fe3+/spermidine/putrescine transport system ATPase subunit
VVEVGAQVKIMVRPEKLKVLKSQPSPEQNYIEGTIRDSLYHGPETKFLIEPKDKQYACPIIQALQTNSAVTARRTFSSGDRVFVSWSPEDCILMGINGPLPIPESKPLAFPIENQLSIFPEVGTASN